MYFSCLKNGTNLLYSNDKIELQKKSTGRNAGIRLLP
nr:MAG TPA: hypothetical protein [Caudoviricetes sp.]DAU21441.1 MAG TPA: hypothetical protein [Caudoviricetes sp.]